MKIEMGESLFYSWLRHVKECQIVQTNWKVSPQWQLTHEDEISLLMQITDKHFNEKYGYKIYKKNRSLYQIIRQGECDALGVSMQDDKTCIYAIDVAFHESGLNYGSREETIMKVVSKCLRTAMCLYGFLNSKDAEIVFASPKINPAELRDLMPCIEDTNTILRKQGFDFHVRIIANDDFNELVLKPILIVSEGVADTSELFLRAHQMYSLFADKKPRKSYEATNVSTRKSSADKITILEDIAGLEEMKIGMIVRTVFKNLLESGAVTSDEIKLLQNQEYSKDTFDIQYPVLTLASNSNGKSPARYYASPITIYGKEYFLCSEWFEGLANNDRPHLMKWLTLHML